MGEIRILPNGDVQYVSDLVELPDDVEIVIVEYPAKLPIGDSLTPSQATQEAKDGPRGHLHKLSAEIGTPPPVVVDPPHNHPNELND